LQVAQALREEEEVELHPQALDHECEWYICISSKNEKKLHVRLHMEYIQLYQVRVIPNMLRRSTPLQYVVSKYVAPTLELQPNYETHKEDTALRDIAKEALYS